MRTPRDPDWAWYVASLEIYTAMIRTRTPFAQANYGDGEWACILGREGENVNGEVYDPTLRCELARTLAEPNGMWCGWNPGSLTTEAESWVAETQIEVTWVFKDTLSAANVNGAMAPFFRACRNRRVTVVGPGHLSGLGDDVVGDHRFVKVHKSRAWQSASAIVDRLLGADRTHDLVLFAAGMGSNLMIHRLRSENPKMTLIDMGACLDPYVGVYSRKNYRREAFREDAMPRNLA